MTKAATKIKEREAFLEAYPDPIPTLLRLGFRKATLDEKVGAADYEYSNMPHSMYGIEKFYHEPLKLVLRFTRSFDKHEFYMLSSDILSFGAHETHSYDSLVENVTKWVKQAKDKQLALLNAIPV